MRTIGRRSTVSVRAFLAAASLPALLLGNATVAQAQTQAQPRAPAPAPAPAPAQTRSIPESVLREAFRNQYDVDTSASIELVVRDRSGHERRRHFTTASAIVDDRLHSIGRLDHPEHLRGMTILQIETPDHHYDTFVYLPSMRSVRRVSTAQRGDAFLGTDLSYEDLERRHLRDYEVLDSWELRSEGELVLVVAAQPREARRYAELRFWVSTRDAAILRVEFFKRGASDPFRSISAPRSGMQRSGEHVLPSHIRVENYARGTSTEVHFRNLRVNPEIDRRVFSVQTLERRGQIPGADTRVDR